jgi:hypothetical protein
VAAHDRVGKVDGSSDHGVDRAGVGASTEGAGQAAQLGMEGRVHSRRPLLELGVRALIEEVAGAHRQQQAGIVAVGAGKGNDRDRHRDPGLERIGLGRRL